VAGDSRIPRPGLRLGGGWLLVVPVIVELSGGGGVDALPHLSIRHRLGVSVSRSGGGGGGAGCRVGALSVSRLVPRCCHGVSLKPLQGKGCQRIDSACGAVILLYFDT
jgi:hypothetical protein